MPRKTFNTKADFDSAYDYNGEPEGHPNTRKAIRVGYCRDVIMPWCKKEAQKLVDIFNWSPDAKILFIGAGFGWTAECLEKDHNFTDIVCTDTSIWIQESKNKDEEDDIEEAIKKAGLDPKNGEGKIKKDRMNKKEKRCKCKNGILNEDLLTTQSRMRVTQKIGGGNFDVAITECVISTLEDSEVLNLSSAMHILANDIIHLDIMKRPPEVGGQDEGYNWKYLEEWKQLLPDDVIVNLEGFVVG